MKVSITGASGLVGGALAKRLIEQGHQVVGLSRNPARAKKHSIPGMEWKRWDFESAPPLDLLDGVEAVVHLAGESVASGRWTRERKALIRSSRIDSTRLLSDAVLKAGVPAFISASAIGLYGDRGDEWLEEKSEQGQGFLPEVVRDWEHASASLEGTSVRRCLIRIGVVLAREGGALEKLLPVFKAGVGGPVGGGQQWMSWVHLDDLVALLAVAVENPSFKGAYNAVAPHPVTNAEFSKVLGKILHRPAWVPTPALALKLALGEMASIVLESQRVKSARLSQAGFRFQHEKLEGALAQLLTTK